MAVDKEAILSVIWFGLMMRVKGTIYDLEGLSCVRGLSRRRPTRQWLNNIVGPILGIGVDRTEFV